MRYAVVLASLASLLSGIGCGRATVSGVALENAFVPLIPPDTKALAGISLDQLKASPLYQRHEKDLTLPMLEGSSERIGIDPRRDLSDVLIAWNGKRPLLLARGRFKPAEVEQKLAALHAPQSTYKNHRIFGEGKTSVVFLGRDVAVEGSVEDVQQTIDLESGNTDSVPEELRKRLRQVPKADQVWIVSRGGLPFSDVPMRSDMESALSNIVNFVSGATVGVKADTGTHFQIDVTCISDLGAKRVHDALRGAIGLGRLSTKDNQRELLQVYDAINVDQDKDLVHVHADFPAELTDAFFGQLRQFRVPMVR